MKLSCHISGIGYGLREFSSFRPKSYLHPFIQYGKQWFEENPNFLDSNNLMSYSEIERHLILSNLLYHSPVISFEPYGSSNYSPIRISPDSLLAAFSTLYPTIQWTRNLANDTLSELPNFHISKDSSDLESLIQGYIPELREIRNSLRQRNEDQILSGVLERLESSAKKRLAYGKTPLSTESLKFIFQCSKIPESLTEFYLSIFQMDNIRIATTIQNPIVNMLDLEEYIEDWYSSSLIKLFALKLLRSKIQILKELGCSLPSEHFIYDEESGEYISKFKSKSAREFNFKSLNPRQEIIDVAKTIPKPVRSNYISVLDYAKALANWHSGISSN